MSQNVMITGTGRRFALGFNLVLRYLEAGDINWKNGNDCGLSAHQ